MSPAQMATADAIPQAQKAAVLESVGAALRIADDHPVKQASQLAPGECLVKLDCSGICHSDLHIARGEWPVVPRTPLIGGHEGVGVVVAIGEYTQPTSIKLGDRVGIKWLAYSCLECEFCRSGLEQICRKAKYSGLSVDGTFSQYVVSWVSHVTLIPPNIESAEAAAILCAGLTIYRAIKHSKAKIGDWIVLPGAGGGLGHLGVQYATAMGLHVIAIDTGEDKRKLCEKLGAERWIDFKETKDLVKDVRAATDGLGPHVAVVAASTSLAYEQAIEYLRPGGTLMVVGLPGDTKLHASIWLTVAKNISICGSNVGNRQDAREALDIACSGKVKCNYTLKPMSALSEVYDGLAGGTIAGRVVLNMNA